MASTQRPMTDTERREFGAELVREAVRQLKHAVRILDGLEWSPVIEGHAADLEHVAKRCKEYAKL